MKTIKYIFSTILITVFMGLGSCSEDFIDVPPLGLASDANFDPVAAVTSAYNIMGNFNNRWSDWRILITGDVLSDDAWKGGSNANDQIDIARMNQFATLPSNVIVRDHWNLFYQRIFRFNWAITNINNLQPQSDLLRRLQGEVKFLRALHYFYLVRIFGDVPLIERPLGINERDLTRESKANVYAFIERELLEAMEMLPLKSQYRVADLGRATKGSAQGLLSKVYLYQGKFQEAFQHSEAVINSGEYRLTPDFADIFIRANQHGPESVFEVTFAENDQRSNPSYHAIAQRSRNLFSGWGLNGPTKDLLNAYEPGDPRIIHTFTFHGDISEGQAHNNAGYDNPDEMHSRKAFKPRSLIGHSANDGENFRVLRYAEILLINAEAANEIGQQQTALNRLNMVRERARNSSLTDRHRSFINYEMANPAVRVPDVQEMDQTVLRNLIWRERRLELALEGDRFYDLVRQGRAGEVLRAFSARYNVDKGSGFVDGVHERFPIPQDEIDRTGGLIQQNPGY